jgi:HD-like signal output (HDOD) protein
MRIPARNSSELKLPSPKAIEAALGELRKLPLMPYAAQQAMALASNENAELGEFTRLLERDVTLATSILKLANSPFFASGRNIDSVEHAVVRLGIRECRNLLIAVAMANLYQQTAPVTKAYCAILWKHCFLTACLTRRLSQELKCDFHGEEFTAGLLHDLGRVLLGITMPDMVHHVDSLDFVEGADLLDREREALGTHHCDFGMHYAEQNKLPSSVIAAIGFHHRFQEAKEHHGILALVIAADQMANYIQRGEPLDQYEVHPSTLMLTLRWSKERTDWFTRRVPVLMSEVANQDAGAPSSGKSPSSAALQRGSANQPSTPKNLEPPKSVWDRMSSWF